MGSSLQCRGAGNHFLNITPVALRAIINKWNLLKLKNFCKAKDIVSKTKRQPREWEKIFTNTMSVRGLISKIHKELKKLDTKFPNNSITKWGAELNRVFSI